MDRDGKPVNENTPLSKLTDEQFIELRDYNNIQLEGWLNNLQNAKTEWIRPPAGTNGPPATPQTPAGKIPLRQPRQAPLIPGSPSDALSSCISRYGHAGPG